MSQGGQGRMEMTGRVLMDSQSAPCVCVFFFFLNVFIDLFVYFSIQNACTYTTLHVPPACVQHAYVYQFEFVNLCVCVNVFECLCVCVFFSVCQQIIEQACPVAPCCSTPNSETNTFLLLIKLDGQRQACILSHMHTRTHTQTLSAQSELLHAHVHTLSLQGFALCVCYLCMCVSNTLPQIHYTLSLLLFPLPQRQSPNFSIACSQRGRRRGGLLESRVVVGE